MKLSVNTLSMIIHNATLSITTSSTVALSITTPSTITLSIMG
jgi:hypothetical protein